MIEWPPSSTMLFFFNVVGSKRWDYFFNAMSTNLECKIEEHTRVGFALELGTNSTVLNN
jgi:hypothetical protein